MSEIIKDANEAYARGVNVAREIDRTWQPRIVTNSVLRGAEVLDAVRSFLARFVSYPSDHALVAHVLWIAHAHAMDAWESTPRLAVLSPEPGSGKTRLLEITALLVPRPLETMSASPAYIVRKVADPAGKPTILLDEIDTVFGPKAKGNEELRALLNAGHRKGAVAGRCIVKGKSIETEEFPAYCAVALAGLGYLPHTILSRSIVIRMHRRAPHDRVEPYRRREQSTEGDELSNRLAEWIGAITVQLATARPEMPAEVTDRDADVWEPLLAIADASGGNWPEAARRASVAFVTEGKENAPSLGVQLLADLKQVLEKESRLSTQIVVEKLRELPERPWAGLNQNGLDARALAQMLKPYGIKPKLIRLLSGDVSRGYVAEDCEDAWKRYLPATIPP